MLNEKRKQAVHVESRSLLRIIAILLLLVSIALNASYQVLYGFNVVLTGSIVVFLAVIVVLMAWMA